MDIATQKCQNNGCKKQFNPAENHDQACNYHPGKPIFHDLKKGWTCCNKIVYDWDEFEKIPTCAVSAHNFQKATDKQEFFQSNTVQNAQKGLDRETQQLQAQQVKIQNVDDYERQEEEKKRKQKEMEEKKEKKIFLTKEGLYKCINKGCLKAYNEKDNMADCCGYHDGQPVFHDTKKYWTCCKKETWDWDEFMKLPTCKVGMHVPKMI